MGPDFAKVLAEHREDYSEHCCHWHDGCTCGWTDQLEGDDSSKAAYDRHLAGVLTAEHERWLAEWLGDEGTRRRVADAIIDASLQSNPLDDRAFVYASAALAALTTHRHDEREGGGS